MGEESAEMTFGREEIAQAEGAHALGWLWGKWSNKVPGEELLALTRLWRAKAVALGVPEGEVSRLRRLGHAPSRELLVQVSDDEGAVQPPSHELAPTFMQLRFDGPPVPEDPDPLPSASVTDFPALLRWALRRVDAIALALETDPDCDADSGARRLRELVQRVSREL